jgi:hypothetical protein
VLSFRKDRQLTIRRSNLSSLEYPIIISKDINGNYNMILDGHHRLLKAINNNIETIKARVLDLRQPKLYQVCLVIKNKKSNYLNDKKVRQIYYRVFVRNYDIRSKYYI